MSMLDRRGQRIARENFYAEEKFFNIEMTSDGGQEGGVHENFTSCAHIDHGTYAFPRPARLRRGS